MISFAEVLQNSSYAYEYCNFYSVILKIKLFCTMSKTKFYYQESKLRIRKDYNFEYFISTIIFQKF
jgi:hypothetical protein